MPKTVGTHSKCASCGKTFDVTLAEHFKQVHQQKCSISFGKNKHNKIDCLRGSDGKWKCPRCKIKFAGSSRRIQDHARKGDCVPFGTTKDDLDVPDDSMHNSDSDEEKIISRGRKKRKVHVKVKNEDRDLDLEDEEAEKQSGSADMSEPDGPQGSRSRSAYLEADRPSHLPTEHLSISKKSTPESDQHPIQRVVVPPTQGAKGSPFQWVKLHTTATNRRLTPLEVLQVVPQSSTNRPALAKAESSSRSASQLIVSAPAACAPSTSSHSSPLIGSVPAGPSLDQSDSSAKMASGAPSPNPLVPPALKAFFDTTRVPLDHLAPIFVQNGFDSDATLDLLCELPPEGHWQDMKDEIMKQGRLAGWLAVQKGLLQRASMLQTQGTS